MKPPIFTYSELKYSTGAPIFQRALDLLKSGKVGQISETLRNYSATVQGTKPYHVNVPTNGIDHADCTCYMGQNDQLCKHILALALAILDQTGKLNESKTTSHPINLSAAKEQVKEGMKRIKPYRGPSKIWFRYQRDLSVGSGIVEDAVAGLPPIKENAKYIWSLVKRLDRKLLNGVDDSDGTVGDCISGLVEQLAVYARGNPELLPTIEGFCSDDTSYDFHVMLEGMIDELITDN